MGQRKREYWGKADSEWMDNFQRMIRMCKLQSAAHIGGKTGNVRADGFANTTYVDVAGATNLDASTAGILKPASSGIDSNTILMLHGDGTNGSTTFTDSSSNALTPTATGSVVLSTSQSEFGGASISVPGSAYLTYASNARWAFGTSNFTIDCWFRPTSLAASGTIWGQRIDSSNNVFLRYNTDGSVTFNLQTSGSNVVVLSSAASAVAINTWYHFAVERFGNTWTLYKNGAVVTSATYSGSWIAQAAFEVGRDGGTNSASVGFIDEFRVSNIARFNGAFTPSAVAYASGYNNLTVATLAETLASVPLNCRAALLVNEIDTVTAGTDYLLKTSRDNGAHWGTFALTKRFTTPDGYAFVTAEHPSLYGLASGSSGRLQFSTANNKNVQLLGWAHEFHPA